jgi:hypothetical protein
LRRLFGHVEESEELKSPAGGKVSAEGKVDFDGGAREAAPRPGNPEEEHNRLLLVQNTPLGGGGEW